MRKISFLFILQLISTGMFAQYPDWVAMYETPFFTSIAADNTYIWMGSDIGITRKNKASEEITYFNKANAPLPDNYITDIETDGNGNSWFGTFSGNLYKYDGSTWQVFDSIGSIVSGFAAKDITLDNNIVWISTGGSVVRFDGTNWTQFSTSNSPLPENSVRSIYFNNGILWIATYHWLVKVEGDVWTQFELPNINNTSAVICMDQDSQDNIWLLHNTVIEKFDGQNFTTYNQNNTNMPEVELSDLSIGPNDKVWVSAFETSAYYAPVGGIMLLLGNTFNKYDNTNSGMIDSDVHNILADEDGNVWFDSQIGLLGKKSASTWLHYDGTPSRLSDARVRHIVLDPAGYAYIGTYQPKYGDESMFYTNMLTWEHIPYYNQETNAIATDQQGLLYVKHGEGIIISNGSDTTELPYYAYINGSPFSDVTGLAVRNPQNIWIDYCDSLVSIYDPEWGGYFYETYYGLAHYNGVYWFQYNTRNSPFSGKPENLMLDSQNNVWFGTFSGLTCFGNDGIWQTYTTDNSSLPFNAIINFTVDGDGNVWFSDNHFGLYKFDRSNCVHFPHPTMNQYSGGSKPVVDIDGSIWQIGLNSLIGFNNNNWLYFDGNNSPLINVNTTALSIDKYGNKWIGTKNGFLVYRQGGVIVETFGKSFIKQTMAAYPNPFSNEFNIRLDRPFPSFTVNLYNSVGNIVYSKTYRKSDDVNIPCGNLKPGMYYYQVLSKGQVVGVGKVVAK